MPAWKEEEIIEASVREWREEVARKIPGAELIVVDDCSPDSTGAIVAGLSRELPEVRCVRAQTNGGHGKALRLGFDYATQPFIFQTDSDRQHRPADFWKLWAVRADADFVFGRREHRADGPLRWGITTCMRVLILALWQLWIRDANCPFKLMRREALDKVLAKIPRDSFIPMVLVSVLSRRMHFRVLEVDVEHLPRTGGTQSLKGLGKWVRIAGRCAAQMWRIRRTAV